METVIRAIIVALVIYIAWAIHLGLAITKADPEIREATEGLNFFAKVGFEMAWAEFQALLIIYSHLKWLEERILR